MIGPRDPMAAGPAGRGRIRASDADRDRVIEALKAAFAAGLLAREEFVTRAGRALESRTYAELAVLIADLRAGPARTPPPREPARRPRKPVNRAAVAWAACAVIVLPALGAAFLTFYGGFLVVLLLAFIGAVVTGQPETGGRR